MYYKTKWVAKDRFEYSERVLEDDEKKMFTEKELQEIDSYPSEVGDYIIYQKSAKDRGRRLKKATSSQAGTDRALSRLHKRIKELERENKKLEQERDAARKAYLDLLSRDSPKNPSNGK